MGDVPFGLGGSLRPVHVKPRGPAQKGLSKGAMQLCMGPAEIGWTERRYGGSRVHGVHACNQHQSVGNKSRQPSPALKSRRLHAGCALWRPHTLSVKGDAPRPAFHLYHSSLHIRSGQCIADWANAATATKTSPALHWHEVRLAPLRSPKYRWVVAAHARHEVSPSESW